MSSYEVKPQKTLKTDLPQSPFMEHKIIAKYPSMTLVIGRSGCGKSTVVCHMCSEKDFYKGFFHYVMMFSPTAEQDDLVKILKIPKKNLILEPSEEKLMEIMDKQNATIKKKGIEWTGKNSRMLCIFDDIVSHKKFLSSPAMLKLAAMGRHSLISSIINTQSYTKIPRGVRLQANSVILFPSNEGEVQLLVDDHCPPKRKKKEFKQLVDLATEGKHDFLHIMCSEPAETRFRKGFGSYLQFAE